MKSKFRFLSLIAGILLLSSVTLFGQAPVLTNAVVNLDGGTLTIFGDNFNLPNLQVFMGTDLGTLDALGINSSTMTSIEAALSFSDPRGTFLIVVSTNVGMSAMDVTFGARVETFDSNSRLGGSALQNNTTGTFNTAVGFNSLRQNTTGRSNTANGGNALRENTIGQFNTASGVGALRDNTEGNNNTATGVAALRANTTGNNNTANGFIALRENTTGSSNTAIGRSALRDNLTGIDNIAIGGNALRENTEGNRNTATGKGALRDNLTGVDNTATGYQVLQKNTEGNDNTATGRKALFNNTTGDSNTAAGSEALRDNTEGFENTAIGFEALRDNTEGFQNTAIGVRALHSNSTGRSNTAIGGAALLRNRTGSHNIAIGGGAGIELMSGDNNILIGNEGPQTLSNRIHIGDSSHDLATIAGVVIVNNSSKRFKKDIHDMGEATTNLMRLRPVTFHYKKEYDAGDGQLQYGLIAEEVAEVYPELVVYDDQGRIKTVLYQQLSGMLLNELQKQHRQVEELTERLTRLEQVLTAQQSLAALKTGQ